MKKILGTIVIILVNTDSMCNLKCSIPKKIPIVFNNGSNYGYHLS